MVSGTKKILFSQVLPEEKIKQIAPGISPNAVSSIAEELDKVFMGRRSPVYIFIKPDLEAYASKFHVDVKELFGALQFLSGFMHDVVKFRAIFIREDEGLFHVLDRDELEEVESKNTLLHPDDPRVVLTDARKHLRHAFVIQPNLDL